MGWSSEDEWVEFDRWIRQKWDEDQKAFPLRVLSFNTEQCPIMNQDWIAMGKPGATEVEFQENQRLETCMILDNNG